MWSHGNLRRFTLDFVFIKIVFVFFLDVLTIDRKNYN